jgi:ribose transport system permease protein
MPGFMETAIKEIPRTAGLNRRMRTLFAMRETGILLALLIICTVLTLSTSSFLTVQNLLNVGRQVSLLGIMAIGMTFVLISREVDLSIGSIYAVAGLSTGMLIVSGWFLLPALGAGLVVGSVIGCLNGFLSTYGRLPSFIATLGMLSVVRGGALLVTNGQPVTVNVAKGGREDVINQFYALGQGHLFDRIPMLLIFFILIAVAAWFLLSKTTFGFRVYAVGGNEKAARLSGIQVFQTKILTFTLMGLLSAVAGILSLAFLPSGQAGRTGVGLELDVIAAAIVGGASLSGGEGTILGTILGVLIIGILRNGLILLGISPFWQTTIIGLVIIFAVGLDKWTERRRNT